MPNQIDISKVAPGYREAIIGLLQSEKLPVEDLSDNLQHFLVATDNGTVIGVVGLETYDQNGLLRSLVVRPEYRKMKIAVSLVNELENMARNAGLNNLYLLTETAQGFFAKNGYETIHREQAPESLKQSTEFSHVCPTTAILMKKTIGAQQI
ncbi:MAG TPA: arsenic resistance N-acetyltransferase ArsN2 [Chitinophagaceae bacterium]|nr:arsenic resistance N-acetyltransferase ArsN2 [Chitinophagaceae bacterium]